MTDFGEYWNRLVKYGRQVRKFDDEATADEMLFWAEENRRKYQDPSTPEWKRPRHVAEAAYCQSLAERKAFKEAGLA
jgi:hypothetical protein